MSGVLDFLLGRKPDPTSEWPVLEFETPEIDLSSLEFGPLRFGCDLKEAMTFGKPELFTWSGEETCELLYARKGFQIDFEKGCFDYLAFFIGADECLPKHPALAFGRPRVKGFGVLSGEIRIDDLGKLFGSPDSMDVDSEETVVWFSRSEIKLEFEINQAGFLKRFSLFPEK